LLNGAFVKVARRIVNEVDDFSIRELITFVCLYMVKIISREISAKNFHIQKAVLIFGDV
jgi:hypothetical protein